MQSKLSRSELILQVALDIVQSGYAELPQTRVEVIARPRSHYDAQYRLEQLQEAEAAFEYINFRKPTQRELSLMTGLSRPSIRRLKNNGVNGQ